MRRSILVLAVGAFLLGGCSSSEQQATIYLDDYASHVSALKGSLQSHGTSIAGTTDKAKVAAIEQSHLSDMSGHFSGMSQDVGMMGQCMNGQGAMMSTGMMGQVDDQAQAECQRHMEAMMNAADMSAAMAEEDAHQATMAGMMDQMASMHDGMMNGSMMGGSMMGASDYMCQ